MGMFDWATVQPPRKQRSTTITVPLSSVDMIQSAAEIEQGIAEKG
jgi:hypothetical protein